MNNTTLYTVFFSTFGGISYITARSPYNPPNKAFDILISYCHRTISILSVPLQYALHSALFPHPAQLFQSFLFLLNCILYDVAFGFHVQGNARDLDQRKNSVMEIIHHIFRNKHKRTHAISVQRFLTGVDEWQVASCRRQICTLHLKRNPARWLHAGRTLFAGIGS